MKTFKCTECGFTGTEEIFENYAVECGFDDRDMVCPECEYCEVEEVELGGFEECEYCGGEFWSEGDEVVCNYCRDVMDELGEEFALAVSKQFGCAPCDIEDAWDNTFRVCGNEYLIVDEDEADKLVTEYIEDSLWAFNSDFLSSVTGFDKSIFEGIIKLYEDGNEAIESLIRTSCGMDEFVSKAVSADGRGNFLASYDGQEIELKVGNEMYYAYKL